MIGPHQLLPYLKTIGLVAAVTALAGLIVWATPLDSVSALYMLPVLIAGVRYGTAPAIFAALLGALMTSLFYPPLFSPLVFQPAQVIDLVTSLAVALTIGPLVDRLRVQSRILDEHRLRERTDALRDILVESVSHELRTPVSGIMGAASVLATAPELSGRAPLLSLATGIEQEARRLDRLIQEVLDLGRIRAGALQPRLDTLDPWDIVNDALATAQERLREHDVRLEPADALPLVRVDPALTAQALVNVLENAAKYTPSGGPIHISTETGEDGVIIAVRDEGAGLDSGEAGLIFERFHRGERHADVAGGSGLGLTIARVFVEASGGRIVALSAGPGRGTTMRFILPIAETKAGDHDDD
ncbi:ATP-binding protein [Bosea sp. BH3]|uniref:sensor histidine kinase n=1 Tax=Bosea sp. BH3 TaxID=2871701 RepID=UPI0021CB7D46|nr:ATP-binding protein [Bosea sp. BH3]MCU4179926.1 DUF4118 domain-containing protein [Bosea sp. BH3]